jgi:hypothetical protein
MLMKPITLPCAAVLLLGLLLADSAGQQAKQATLESANALFREGKFAEAEPLYARIQAQDPRHFEATLRLGTIALFKNKLADAEAWLTKARQLRPDDRTAMRRLAQVYYRRDDFQIAGPLYRALGVEPVAKKLESFKGALPYQIEGKADVTDVAFLHTDPLPLIEVKVNGRETVHFIIDTGGSEIYIDPALAKKVKAPHFGSTTGSYGGGLQADTGHGRIDSLTLGGFVIRNVPVHVLGTQRFAVAARGKRVDGILGTTMLSHFLATLDYPNGKLILRRQTKGQLKQFDGHVKAAKGTVIPFWMAGDHFLVAWGKVNKSKPLLLFVDTGLAGGGFLCPRATLKEAAIELAGRPALEGIGGGGKVKLVPFEVEELALGAVKERRVRAFFGPFPERLEYGEGFRIGGIISHQFFRPYALTFDFTEMRMFLTKGKP